MGVALGLLLAHTAAFYFYDRGRGVYPFADAAPDFSAPFLLRTALTVGLVLLLVGCASRLGRPRSALDLNPTVAVLAIGLAAAPMALHLLDPQFYSALRVEDGPLEWLQALLLFAAALLAMLAARAMARRAQPWRWRRAGAAGLFGFGAFFLGMEEISWMQRILGLETPPLLAGNQQGELNLHNLSSDRVMMAFAAAMFAGFILLPAVWYRLPDAAAPAWIAPFVPGMPALLVAAPFASYNWDIWNLIPYQAIFFGTLAVLVLLARDARRQGAAAWPFAAMAAVLALSQAATILNGDRFVRDGDSVEYKELFATLAIALLGWQLWLRRR